jgi:hypothetical protein
MTMTLAIILAIISLWPLANYLIMPRQDPFNPLIFVGATTFFVTDYGILTDHDRSLRLVSDTDLSVFVTVVIVSLLGFYAGWHWRRRREDSKHLVVVAAPERYRPHTLLNSALVLAAVGVTVALYTRTDYLVTGYLRDLGGLWVAAAILALQATFLNPAVGAVGLLTAALCLIPPVDRFFSYGQRGDTFRIALLAIPFYLLRKRRPARVFFVPMAIFLALTLGTLDRTRKLVSDGEATGRVDALFKVIPSFFEQTQNIRNYGGKEYIFGTAMVATVRDQQSYEYGAFLYNIGVRFIPKEAFDKLGYFTRWNNTNYGPMVGQHAGFEVSGGAAPTGFAHVFVEFGWGAPLFWFVLGSFTRRLYARAVSRGDLAGIGYLTAVFVVLLYLITQDLLNATMNAIYTFPALYLVYRVARVPEAETQITREEPWNTEIQSA